MVKMEEPEKTVEVEEISIIIRIPKEAAALTVTATVLEDGEPVKMLRRFSVQDIFEARQAFLDNVEDGDDYDGYFVITDEGKKYLEEVKEGGDAR